MRSRATRMIAKQVRSMGRDERMKRARREGRIAETARNPLSTARRYVDCKTVFGGALPPSEMVERIKTWDWRNSFARLGALASSVVNDHSGPSSAALQQWARQKVLAFTGTGPHIPRAHAWARSCDDAVVVHEEALDFLQHVVLMYGLEEGEVPKDTELVLWLIGAGDLLGEWEEDVARDDDERLIAEMVRIARYNNNEDPVHLIVRIRELFG